MTSLFLLNAQRAARLASAFGAGKENQSPAATIKNALPIIQMNNPKLELAGSIAATKTQTEQKIAYIILQLLLQLLINQSIEVSRFLWWQLVKLVAIISFEIVVQNGAKLS